MPIFISLITLILTLAGILSWMTWRPCHNQTQGPKTHLFCLFLLPLIFYTLLGAGPAIYATEQIEKIQNRMQSILSQPSELIALLERRISLEPHDKKAYQILKKVLLEHHAHTQLTKLSQQYQLTFGEAL